MQERPDEECGEAHEDETEGDQRGQPPGRAGDRQGGDDERVGEEDGRDEDRPQLRPAQLSRAPARHERIFA